MTTTDDPHVALERAAGIAALDASDPERQAAEKHARSCADCARLLARGANALSMLESMPAPTPPDAAMLARVRASIATELRETPRARTLEADPPPLRPTVHTPFALDLVPPLLTLAAAFVVVLGAADPHADARAITLASVATAGAVLAMLATRRLGAWTPAVVTSAALVASFALAMMDRHVPVDVPWPKIGCTGIELGVALLPVVSVAWITLRGRRALRAFDLAAVAACGALAAQGALVIACPGQTDRAHVLGLHVTGVVLAALLGAAASRLRVLRPRSGV